MVQKFTYIKTNKMKKNDWILTGMTAIYSFLFYGELPGLNLSIFTLVIIAAMVLKNKEILKNKNWLVIALSCLITAFSVSYLGNTLSLLANYISLFILIGMSLDDKSSVFFSLIYGLYSTLSSPILMYLDKSEKKSESVDVSNFRKKALLISIPVLITVIFFFMYKNSNPIFASFANKINFDWISWGWIFFTLTGFAFLYGVIHAMKIQDLVSIDEVDTLDINSENKKELHLFGKPIAVVDEYFSGKLLFILLNVLIAVVNLLDFNFLFVDQKVPGNLTLAQFLHQGVGMLVVSIAISIAIILFYFRGQLNFYKENKTFKMLAYFWIMQNIFMLLSVCFKNSIYINNYGLTYKRIGIYIYAILTLIGLITTLLKVYKVKINLYLVRLNGWTFYAVFLISSLINWDKLIIDFNKGAKMEYDVYYILSLSDSNIPAFIELKDSIKDKSIKYQYSRMLNSKIYFFNKNHSPFSWKSWNYQDAKAIEALKKYTANR